MPSQLLYYVEGYSVVEAFPSKRSDNLIISVQLFLIFLIVDYINETVRGHKVPWSVDSYLNTLNVIR